MSKPLPKIRLLTDEQRVARQKRKSIAEAYADAAMEKQIALLHSVKANLNRAH